MTILLTDQTFIFVTKLVAKRLATCSQQFVFVFVDLHTALQKRRREDWVEGSYTFSSEAKRR